ncbi:MAG: cell division protein FtsA [Candidatus Goldiibacteriota bacterium]
MVNSDMENIIAAVDIGTTKVCTVIAEIRGEEINVIGVGWQENNGVSKGSVVNIADTSKAIKRSIEKAEEMANVGVDAVIASISGKHIMGIKGHGMSSLSHSKQKEISEADIDRAVEGATSLPMSNDRETLHVLPMQYIVDSQDEIRNPLGMTGMKLEVDAYIITGATTAIDNVRKVIDKAGYKAEDIILQPLGSAEAVLYQDEKDIGVLLVDIGGGTTDLALYYKDSLRFVKVIPVGGNLITNDLVQGLQTPKITAEEIKRKYGVVYGEDAGDDEYVEVPDMGSSKVENVLRRELTRYIRPRIQELVRFIQAELEKENIDKTMYAGGIVITGGSSLLNGVERLIKEETNMRVRVGAPLKEKVIGLYDIVSTPEYSTAIGLIDYYMHEQGVNNYFLKRKGFFDRIWLSIKKIISEYI